ncbi:hypothetical protein [Roseivivax lentus]|uniref:hypothetical protein n=1 Tax=Roseivivax lentus TaxID=633194 RepID=UPI0013565C6C|nr:hypothetical protein [Roseivivax lentus]
MEATSDADYLSWLAFLDMAVSVEDVRFGADANGVGVEATLTANMEQGAFSDGFPFAIFTLSDVQFRILNISSSQPVRLIARLTDAGPEVLLEGLPVEIGLPEGLVIPPDPEEGTSDVAEIEKKSGKFISGSAKPDDQEIIIRRSGRTTIRTHIRLHMDAAGDFTMRFAVPVNFSKCKLSGIPCLAVHGFTLIPSPTRATDELGWIHHGLEPWDADANPIQGQFAVRALEIDPMAEPIRDAARALTDTNDTDPTAVLVIEDLVVPFYSLWVLPIPRHITIGVRRRNVDPFDIEEVFDFNKAPVKGQISSDPNLQLILESFFFRSMPIEELDRDLGLTFKAGLVIGSSAAPGESGETIDHNTILLELGENYTVRAGYKREFSAGGLPEAGTGGARTINDLLHWEIANTELDVMALRAGYAIGKAVSDGAGFADCFELTIDLWVTIANTDAGVVQIRGLSGNETTFAVTDLGWKQGSLSLKTLAFPDGVMIVIARVAYVILEELGLAVENGATYFTITGGLGFELPSGFKGSASVKRLRFNIAGNPDAPTPLLDGAFARFEAPQVKIEFGGYYTKKTVDQNEIEEFAMSGKVAVDLGADNFSIGLDMILGKVRGPVDDFNYQLFFLFARASIPAAAFEFRGARLLFANNMQPKLDEQKPGQLRYYTWYKSSLDTLSVPAERRLAKWQAQNDAWAFGVGLNASIASLGKILELGVFVMGLDGPEEGGLLIVGEAFLASNPKPVAFLAIEWDGKEGRFSMLLGIDLSIAHFVDGAPDWLGSLITITGSLFISNDPGTVAIGRIADQRSWFRLVWNIDFLLGKTFFEIGFCFEWSEGPDGATGFGLIVRAAGGMNAGIIRLEYNLGFGLVVASFNTGSSAFAVAVWIEGGLRFVLFGFIRFGISAKIEFRVVGPDPSRGELTFTIKLETPWFLPDITWTFEKEFGELEPERLSVATGALRSGGARQAVTNVPLTLFVTRLDANWDGTGAAPVHSIESLRGFVPQEAQRLTAFANADIDLLPTDATVSVDFTVAIDDGLGIGGAGADQGKQKAGDLDLRYRLVGVEVRRRARFGADRSWKTIAERVALEADFSDPSGATLSGEIGPQAITMMWDTDVRISSETAAKRLLLNSEAPFEYNTQNPEADDEVVEGNPNWPCCGGQTKRRQRRRHIITFTDEVTGDELRTPPAGARLFSDSMSPLRLPLPTTARPPLGISGAPASMQVAAVTLRHSARVFTAEFDAPAIVFVMRFAWIGADAELELIAEDAQGDTVGTERMKLRQTGALQSITLAATGPMRRVVGRVILGQRQNAPNLTFGNFDLPSDFFAAALEIERQVYIAVRDWIDDATEDACNEGSDAFRRQYEGKGKFFWLPNHDYEVAVKTQVSVDHPQVDEELTDITEHLMFATKGWPGLNASEEVGDEVRPYVASSYNGGRGTLYREEPVAIAMTEELAIAVPLAHRPAGSTAEETQLFAMRLVAEPQAALISDTPGTATSGDWIVAHRTFVAVVAQLPYAYGVGRAETAAVNMISTNPLRERLAGLTQRPEVDCGLADPRDVIGSALLAYPEGAADPEDPARKLWPTNTPFRAVVRPDGAPFVHRAAFQPADATAFAYRTDGNTAGTSWTVSDGLLAPVGTPALQHALFGEPDWLHASVTATLRRGTGRVGVGLACPATGIGDGIFVFVDASHSPDRLVIARRNAAGGYSELNGATLQEAAGDDVLVITSFDDKVRAQVGDVVVDADRGELREGRFCLSAEGSGGFLSLSVRGLALYDFDFQPSRYMGFAEHVASWGGAVDRLTPNLMGTGTTTTTVSALCAATRAAISTAMDPAAPALDRAAMFEQWTTELGLPLRTDPERLEISAFDESGTTRALLLESPERLDFTEEVTLQLTRIEFRRRAITPGLSLIDPPVIDRIIDRFSRVEAPPMRTPPRPFPPLERFETSLGTRLTTTAEIAAGATVTARILATETANGQLLIALGDDKATSETRRIAVPQELRGTELRVGDRIDLTADLDRVLEHWRLEVVETGVDVVVLQNAEATCAIVIPVSGANAVALDAGQYRIDAGIARARWATTSGADDANTYEKNASLILRI